MQIKRYEATSVQDALTKIRKDLGEDVVILSTKRLRSGKQPLFEVTAARDEQNFLKPLSGEKDAGAAPGNPIRDVGGRLDEMAVLLREIRSEGSLRAELAELKATLNTFFDLFGLRGKDLGQLAGTYYRLVANGISDERVRQLIQRLRKSEMDHRRSDDDRLDVVEDLIRTAIPVSSPGTKKRTLVFVGPTGSGKTTTLAKLAAHYALKEKSSVGLITTDTYRIAAVDQLRTYAKIMGLPLEVTADRETFRKALHRFSDRQTVLVDTPGRSQKDGNHIMKLRDMVRDAPVETHLLLSPTSSRDNMLDTASRFGVLAYDSLIFTKLDECTNFGAMYDVIAQIGKPVSCVTTGQKVPQDIEMADSGRIARLIVRNQFH